MYSGSDYTHKRPLGQTNSDTTDDKNGIFETMKIYLIFLLGCLANVSVAQTPQTTDAKKLYQSKCARCHGKSGDKGLFHASKLSQSRIDQSAVALIIQTGKGAMPPFSKKLTEQQVEAIAAYVLLLRK